MTASPTVGRVLTLVRIGSDLSRVLVINEASTWLGVFGENGERTVLYQHDTARVGGLGSSPDGHWVLYSTEEAGVLVPSDGASPPQRFSSPFESPRFDRTGRFVLARVPLQAGNDWKPIWKIWNLASLDAPTEVLPAGFEYGQGWLFWIQ